MALSGRPDWLSDELFPYESRFLELDGCRLHYVDEGRGPILLLLPGNPTWSFLYRHLVVRLRHRFRCVAVDYPGFGLSSSRPGYGFTPAEHAAVVEQVVAELGLDSFTPVVHDWGGPIGLAVASRHSERRRFEAVFPRHHRVVFEQARHYLHEDVPDELAAAIEEWWGDDGP